MAPLLGVLCSIGWQRTVPKVYVHAEPGLQRCFEGEQTQVSVWASAEPGDVAVALAITGVDGMRVDVADGDPAGRQTVSVAADRWGRYPIRATVDVVAPGGLLAGTATVDATDVFVFPVAPPQSTAIPRTELLDRLGTHLTRHIGPGVEYADIRPYVPGDQLRTVNWPVSARRGSLHVTQRLTDRAADVVVLIDMYAQPPGPATEATERALRGAVQVVQSALRSGDRAGIVTLGGGRPRWLGADIGRRQFYRVLDTLLGAGDEFETTTGTLAPRAALPPGAIVVGFSTMLDTEFALSLIDLRKRGHTVVAVDVLEGAPFEDGQGSVVHPDVGDAAVVHVPRHGDRRGGRRVLAVGAHARPVDAAGARAPTAGAGAAMMSICPQGAPAFGGIRADDGGGGGVPNRRARTRSRDARGGHGAGRASRFGSRRRWPSCRPPRRSSSPMRRRCWPRSPACPRRATWCCGTPRAARTRVLGASAPAMLAALGFTFVGVLAASFPFELPWLPLLAPLAVFGIYVLATRPFYQAAEGKLEHQFQILTRCCGSR